MLAKMLCPSFIFVMVMPEIPVHSALSKSTATVQKMVRFRWRILGKTISRCKRLQWQDCFQSTSIQKCDCRASVFLSGKRVECDQMCDFQNGGFLPNISSTCAHQYCTEVHAVKLYWGEGRVHARKRAANIPLPVTFPGNLRTTLEEKALKDDLIFLWISEALMQNIFKNTSSR